MAMELMIRRPHTHLLSPWRMLDEDFEDVLGGRFLPALWSRTPSEERFWMMPIELFEKDDKYVVRAELPGMKLEDIDVSVSENDLTIKGERKLDEEVKERDYYYREHGYGTFCRTVSLPSTVDEKKIEATYDSGILQVTIPKSAAAKPKKIPVLTTRKSQKSEK